MNWMGIMGAIKGGKQRSMFEQAGYLPEERMKWAKYTGNKTLQGIADLANMNAVLDHNQRLAGMAPEAVSGFQNAVNAIPGLGGTGQYAAPQMMAAQGTMLLQEMVRRLMQQQGGRFYMR